MKQILLLVAFAAVITGCSTQTNNDGCAFHKVELKAGEVGSDSYTKTKEISDCFTVTGPDQGGLVEIKGKQTGASFKVDYYKEANPNELRIMNVMMGGKNAEWRQRKGHDLFIKGTPQSDTLTLIFGDRNYSKVKGVIKFAK